MRGSSRAALVLAAGALAAAASAATSPLAPGRTLSRPGPITALAVTSRSVVFAVGETRRECAHVELWDTASRGLWRLGRPTTLPCKERPSTGSGVWSVTSTARRALWLTFVGGNIREWQLWTATPTRRTPRQLRLVGRDVDAPPPIVLGPGTSEGVPYAVDTQVVYLGDDGAAIFTASVAEPARLLAAGAGPGQRRVAALLAGGDVVTIDRSGAVVDTYEYDAGAVRALQLAGAGAVIQVGSAVEIRKGGSLKTVALPAAARMLDYREGRIYYALGKQVRTVRAASGADELLLSIPAPPGRAPLFSIDRGAAWGAGTTLNWRT